MFTNFVVSKFNAMKNLFKHSGFETVFYAGLFLLIILPAMVFAQDHKSVTIIVHDGDTTVNGKKLSELKSAEKQDALKLFADADKKTFGYKQAGAWSITEDTTIKGLPRYQIFGGRMGQRLTLRNPGKTGKDSVIYFYLDTINKGESPLVYTKGQTYRYNAPRDHMPTIRPDMSRYRMPVMGRDMQDFDYHNIDKNGINTNLNFHVSIPSAEEVKKVSGAERADLEIRDLVFVPELSTGKTTMIFNLPTNTPATVSFTDSDGKALWVEKATSEKVIKTFLMPANGVYYLVVKQGVKTGVRRVVRE
ncbi:hypothetical protein GCM10028826_18370 [Mucilaginibacter boryungensis]